MPVDDARPVRRPLSRRSFLQGSAAAGASALLAAGFPAVIRAATKRRADTPLRHVVISMQENRSFDTYFGFAPWIGKYGPPNGYTQPDGHGGSIAPYHFESLATPDVPHDWGSVHDQWNGGAMNGFYTNAGIWALGYDGSRPELYQVLKDLGAKIETGQSPSPQALSIVAPLGFDVTTVAVVERLDPARTLGIDMLIDDAVTKRRVLATNPATRPDMRDAAHALFARDGKAVSVIRDSGGFVTQRVVATIVNIAADICQQGICSPRDLETAVTLGLGYPLGPLAMGDRWGPTNVLEVLFNMQTVYGDPRYRPSPWLRRRGAIGLSLLHEEP